MDSNAKHLITTPAKTIAPDCRHYLGDRPCIHNQLCQGCLHYAPFTQRICIIKLGALGDVIRTLCILPKLRSQYPNAQITWVTKPNGRRMIESHPWIDQTLEFNAITAITLMQQHFDLVICLDKEVEPCGLAMALSATEKLGIGLSVHGTPIPLNAQGVSYFELGLSDDLKFKINTKSYAQLIYNAFGWRYEQQRYDLPVDGSRRKRIASQLALQGWQQDQKTVGINVGAGAVFANKMLSPNGIVDVICNLSKQVKAVQIILLGGPSERVLIDDILAKLKGFLVPINIFDGQTEHDEPSFVALVDLCEVVFSGDTMAMHVAIARQKQVVAFFGPTCEQEIDLFGSGQKVIGKTHCSPCYKRQCDQKDICLETVLTRDIVSAIVQSLQAKKQAPCQFMPSTYRQAS